jgi:hypothetical protein
MNFYNLVCGENPEAEALLGALGLTRKDFGQYLDCWIVGDRIGVFTRDGGAQRPAHDAVFAAMKQHPCYLEDRDDLTNGQYCTFYFRVPETHRLFLHALGQGERGYVLLQPILDAIRVEPIR